MPRKRRTNKTLPQHVYFKHGAYYFVTPVKKWIRLGKTLTEVYQKLAYLTQPGHCHTMKQLIHRYMTEVAPKGAFETYKDKLRSAKFLEAFYGEMEPSTVIPTDIYKYLDIRGLKSEVRANREFALLSHIFVYAVRWGIVTANPCRDVKKFSEKPKERYVSDEDFVAFVNGASDDFVRLCAELIYMTGMRPGEPKHFKKSYILEDRLLIWQSKVKKFREVILIPELEIILEQLLALPRQKRNRTEYLLTTKDGKPYTQAGFASLFYEEMTRAMNREENQVKHRFSLQDIRPKVGTDAEDIEAARRLLGHTTQNMTRVYLRKRIIGHAVKPKYNRQ